MPIHVFRLHRAVAPLLSVLLAILAFHSSAQAKPVTGDNTPSVAGGSNTCTVTSCGQCGQTCTAGWDKWGNCLGYSCNRCTVTTTGNCPGTCTVTSCAQCGQSCSAGFDKWGQCMGWSCNACAVSDSASCGRACPTAIPQIVDAFDAQCFVGQSGRCPSEVSQVACAALINNAARAGLLTPDAISYLGSSGYCPILRPTGTGLLGFCPMGCFASDTQILTALNAGAPSYVPVSQVLPDGTVLSTSDDATMDDVALVSRSVGRVVSGPETLPLIVLALSNGATLRVTTHHPMVLDTGVIVEAQAIVPGARFMGVNGRRVNVVAVGKEATTQNVYNFETTGATQLSHVVVAEGVLIGDLKLQNELAVEENVIELRRAAGG